MESQSWTPDSTQQKDTIFHGKYDELMSTHLAKLLEFDQSANKNGKKSFDDDKLKQNIEAVVTAIVKAKPASAKGTYFFLEANPSPFFMKVEKDTGLDITGRLVSLLTD